MNRSSQLKRKGFAGNNSSDDENEQEKNTRLIKDKQRRKKSTEEELTGLFYLVQYVSEPTQYSIVDDKGLKIDPDDDSVGKVICSGKKYTVVIKKRGTKQYVTEASKLYEYNLSVRTCDENDSQRQLKEIKSKLVDKTNSYNSKSSSAAHDLMDLGLFDEDVEVVPKKSQLNISNCQDGVSKELFDEFKNEMERKFKIQQESNDLLLKELREIKEKKFTDDKNKFTYKGKDLIRDVYGTPPHVWVANCCSVLFTEEENKNCVLTPSTSSDRPACCPDRVKLLREALEYKYDLPADKIEKIWKSSVKAFNTKGRGILYQINKAKNAIKDRIGTSSNKE